MTVKRCTTCGRFHAYEEADAFCVECGHRSLDTTCACGRTFEYAMEVDGGTLHCPRCGARLLGRGADVE